MKNKKILPRGCFGFRYPGPQLVQKFKPARKLLEQLFFILTTILGHCFIYAKISKIEGGQIITPCPPTNPPTRAVEHFQDFTKANFRSKIESIRIRLLTTTLLKHKIPTQMDPIRVLLWQTPFGG